MKEIVSDSTLVAYCGLYCGACKSYLKGKCPGCQKNEKATWCKVRSCCQENKYTSCASCETHTNQDDCKKFNNFISKIFGLVFKSDRKACLKQIEKLGIQGHANNMANSKRQTIKR